MRLMLAAVLSGLLLLAPSAGGKALDDDCNLCGLLEIAPEIAPDPDNGQGSQTDPDNGQNGQTDPDDGQGSQTDQTDPDNGQGGQTDPDNGQSGQTDPDDGQPDQPTKAPLPQEPPPGGWILLLSEGEPGTEFSVDSDFAWHRRIVKAQLTGSGVWDKYIRLDTDLFSDGFHWSSLFFDPDGPYAELLPSIRVVNMSWGPAFSEPGVAEAIGRHNVLFVTAAGNTPLFGNGGPPDTRFRGHYTDDRHSLNGGMTWDMIDYYYQADHPGHSAYDEMMAALATGKAILAVWANVDEDGNYIPYDFSVKCGDTRESCFALVIPPKWRENLWVGTSQAAPRLSAYAFYLSHLWDKAEEVTHTLRECAIDIGEPGPDEEFGQGIVNVDCDRVQERERAVAEGSIRLAVSSPTLDAATGSTANASFAGAGLFIPLTGKERWGLTPSLLLTDRYRALSLSARIAKTTTRLSLGTGTRPLGASSRFLPQARTPFLEIGITRTLRFGRFSAAVLGSHGKSTGFSVTRLGLRLHNPRVPVSLYAGAALGQGRVDIPGRRAAGRPPVPVRTLVPELRFRCDLPLPHRLPLF